MVVVLGGETARQQQNDEKPAVGIQYFPPFPYVRVAMPSIQTHCNGPGQYTIKMGMHKARRCLAADAAVSFPGAPDEAWMWNKKPTDAHRELVPSSLWSHWLRAGDARPQERAPVRSDPGADG